MYLTNRTSTIVDCASDAFSMSSLTIEYGLVITWPLHTERTVATSSFCILLAIKEKMILKLNVISL